MANPNIVNVTTIYGNTAALAVSSTTTNVVSNPTSSGSIYKINLLSISNYSTNNYSVTAELNIAGTNTNIVKNVVIPSNSSLAVIGKDTAIYLLENSSIQLSTTQNSAFHAICSWEQIS
jgi:hypothetical protein